MSAKHGSSAACAVADAALEAPVFHVLRRLNMAQFTVEQPLVRASYVGDDGFRRSAPAGERLVRIILEGWSDASDGEALLVSGILHGAVRVLRFDTAQAQRYQGQFRVVQFAQQAHGDGLETIRVELESHGGVVPVSA